MRKWGSSFQGYAARMWQNLSQPSLTLSTAFQDTRLGTLDVLMVQFPLASNKLTDETFWGFFQVLHLLTTEIINFHIASYILKITQAISLATLEESRQPHFPIKYLYSLSLNLVVKNFSLFTPYLAKVLVMNHLLTSLKRSCSHSNSFKQKGLIRKRHTCLIEPKVRKVQSVLIINWK